nr:protein transport protein sec61 subunit gamma [Quercus suber]
MEAIDSVFNPLREFAKDSVCLVKRCHKPDHKGVNSIEANLNEQLLTITGEMDAVAIAKKLKKIGKTEVVSVGPDKEDEKEEEKEENKDEKK